jgi:hypothetical protein
MNRVHIMIVLETFATSVNASVATIGAVKFIPGQDETCSNTFYRYIDRNSCKELNLDEDEQCLKWWYRQNKLAQDEVFSLAKNRVSIVEAFGDLANFCKDVDFVWGNSCCFDLNICENIYY